MVLQVELLSHPSSKWEKMASYELVHSTSNGSSDYKMEYRKCCNSISTSFQKCNLYVSSDWSTLDQIMACCMFSVKQLPETKLTFCQLDSHKHASVNFQSKFQHFQIDLKILEFQLKFWVYKFGLFCHGLDLSSTMHTVCYVFVFVCMWFDIHHITHLPLDKMATTSQTVYSDAFSWMKSFVF